MVHLVQKLGAAFTMALGAAGLFAPKKIQELIELTPDNLNGKAEIRATYGGVFLLLGLGCFISGNPAAYHTLGYGWLGAAIGRSYSVVVDGSSSRKNLLSIAFEASFASLLLFTKFRFLKRR